MPKSKKIVKKKIMSLTDARPYRAPAASKTTVKDTELIGSVTVPIVNSGYSTILAEYDINPLFMGLPKLAMKARLFEKHKLKSMTFHYIPSCSKTQAGQLMLSYEADINDPLPSGTADNVRSIMFSMSRTAVFPVCEEFSWRVPIVAHPDPFFISTQTLASAVCDWRNVYDGAVYLTSMNDNATAFAAGSITVSYEWDLIQPQLEELLSVAPAHAMGEFLHEDQQSPGIAKWFADAVTYLADPSWVGFTIGGVPVGAFAFIAGSVLSAYLSYTKSVVTNTAGKATTTSGSMVDGYRVARQTTDGTWVWARPSDLLPAWREETDGVVAPGFADVNAASFTGAYSAYGAIAVTPVTASVGTVFPVAHTLTLDHVYCFTSGGSYLGWVDLRKGFTYAMVPFVADDFTLNAFDISLANFVFKPSSQEINLIPFDSLLSAAVPPSRVPKPLPKRPGVVCEPGVTITG